MQCVESIFAHGSALAFEVIVVDNGSDADVGAWLRTVEGAHANVRHLRFAEPIGFAPAVNAGAAAATGDALIVLNSDTIVTAGWMDHLHRALMADPSLGAVSPTTNHAGEPAQMDYGTIDLGPTRAMAAAGANTREPYVLHLPQRITFFCVALRRAVWERFGGLDESYKVGNYEDDDLCLRLRMGGYRLGVALHVFVYHHNNATFTANRLDHREWMAHNAGVFAERARRCALEGANAFGIRPQWPRRSSPDVTVVILPRIGAPLEHTLRSLEHQTVDHFEIIFPGDHRQPSQTWITYVMQGDILYPFYIEALLEALQRNSADAIFADAWIAGGVSPVRHPDAADGIRSGPLLLAGWMHHASLDPAKLWEQCVPRHWPRLSWEMREAPHPAAPAVELPPPPPRTPVGQARRVYRALVPYETRLKIDAGVRRVVFGKPPMQHEDEVVRLAEDLERRAEAARRDRARHSSRGPAPAKPAVIMFNAVAWNSVMQRQHHFARGLARLGHPVIWIEPALSPLRHWWSERTLQQAAPGIYVIRLPATDRQIYKLEWTPELVRVMTAALRKVAADLGWRDAVALVNYPRFQPLAGELRKLPGWKLASDCLDDQRAMANLYQTALFRYEDLLTEQADLLITSSVVLQQRLARPSLLLHNGNDYEVFSSATPAGHLQHLPRPIVGFFGALADWIDVDLVRAAAEHFPEWTFVYIGPMTFSNAEVEFDWLRKTHVPNIVLLPQMPPRTLAAHLAEFDVCTLPFRDIPVTRTMNPVKLYEYLAAGKPAVARDLPEVRYFASNEAKDLVALYRTPDEFFACLRDALAADTEALAARRREFARRNDWAERVAILSERLTALSQEISSMRAVSSGSKTRDQS